MPKYRKDRRYVQDKEEKKLDNITDKVRMFFTSKKSYIIAFVFLGLSIIFNMELINPITEDSGQLIKLIVYGFRSLLVILFFFFTLIAWGNMKELRGGILGVKEIIILVILALIQTVRNGYVFLAAIVGVVAVVIYIWLMQVKIQNG